MNPNEATRENEFIFRRLGDSFLQFVVDLWGSAPLWLLILAAAAIALRVGYSRYYMKGHPHAKQDPVTRRLGWIAGLTTALLIGWVLLAFYHRDSEQVKSGGIPQSALAASNTALWYAFVGTVFGLGSFFVVLMYIKDSKSVRWYYAALLATLRICVYGILCFVFLLPAVQTKERVYKNSRVVVLVDITPSMTQVTDEVLSRGRKAKTRMDLLIDFLTDDNVKLMQKLLKDNPVAIYPFGTRLDETPSLLARNDRAWGKAEWEAFVKYDFRPFIEKGLSDEGKAAVQKSNDWQRSDAGNAEWAASLFARREDAKLVEGLNEQDLQTFKDNLTRVDRRIDVARSIALGTNVPDSITAAVNRESPNMVQGVIVFSDGRSNLGSDAGYRELRSRAQSEKVPILTVTVGEDRQTSSITITGIQVDDMISPDEGTKVVVEADGVNLAGKSVDAVLDLFYLGKDGKLKDPKTATPDFTFDAATSPTKQPYQLTFAQGDPPHGQVEFVIDPGKLAATPQGSKLTEESRDAAIKKPVLKEGQWSVRARIPKHENEAFTESEHIREQGGLQVVRKKLRVLLMASAPNREFQFLRTFLVREVQENRAEVTILIQNEAGSTGNLTPNPTEQIIGRFPNKLDLTNKTIDPKEKQYNLNQYDLIVAFDPDWSEITQQQAEDLQLWVERQGGGLIYVADQINTFQLARIEPNSRLSPLLEILPVLPEDVIAVKIRRIARTPRRLYLHPIGGSDLLKIDDQVSTAKKDGQADQDPIAGWERYFTDRDKYTFNPDSKIELFPHRGFYSCYPIKELKPGAKVLAEFADIDDRGEKLLRPWLVTNNPSSAWRTCFVGSGEVYRMFAYDREYYERYWAKLMKYMAAKRNVKASRGRVLISKEISSGSPIRVQAQVLNTNSKPYPVDGPGKIEPKFTIRQLTPTGEKREFGPYEMQPAQYEGYYRGQVPADPKQFPTGEGFEYTAVVEVPESAGDTLQGKFQIVKADPEKDNTKPDFAAMLAMASDYDDAFQTRIKSEGTKTRFAADLPKENGIPKLAFKLGDPSLIGLIPECFAAKESHADNNGPVNDLWDKGIDFPNQNAEGTFIERNVPEFLAGKKLQISWVMLVVISLFSLEWLSRKLLRLA
jgi:hypothetical protein